jgi:transposase-like protein
MFELPVEIRRVVYTTNVIESLNFSLRKIIEGRSAFPNAERDFEGRLAQSNKLKQSLERQIREARGVRALKR